MENNVIFYSMILLREFIKSKLSINSERIAISIYTRSVKH